MSLRWSNTGDDFTRLGIKRRNDGGALPRDLDDGRPGAGAKGRRAVRIVRKGEVDALEGRQAENQRVVLEQAFEQVKGPPMLPWGVPK